MGKRGPKPTPTETLAKKRSEWANRPNRRREAKARKAKLQPPKHLTREEKATWKLKYSQLTECGLIANLDADALTRYAVNWNRWLKLKKQVQKQGEVITEHRTEYSITKVNPAATQLHHVAMELHKLEAMFGMSPADRAGLAPTTDKEDESDPFVRLASFGDKESA